MKYKWAVLLVVSFSLLLAYLALNSARHVSPHVGNVEVLAYAQDDRHVRSRLDELIPQLRADKESERVTAKESLVLLSHESVATRQTVIEALLKIIRTPNNSGEFVKSPPLYKQWKGAVEVIASIRAVEAIDDLIACLDCNNGLSGLSPDMFPATRAVIRMGEESIPKLSQALEQKPKPIQYLAIMALVDIGGDKAKSALEQALPKAKEKEIADDIRDLLKRWKDLNPARQL